MYLYNVILSLDKPLCLNFHEIPSAYVSLKYKKPYAFEANRSGFKLTL
jgi:hypothetical protein